MAKSAPKILRASEPPSDLDAIKLPIALAGASWYRICHKKYPSCIYWSRSGDYRFDSPGARWGVCYSGGAITSAFQEVWGDVMRKQGRLDWLKLKELVVWKIDVDPALKTVELAGTSLATVKATVQCFVTSYPLSQRWGAAFMLHPDHIDGLQYIGRRCGRTCLALFGDKDHPKAHQLTLRETRLGVLPEWRDLWAIISAANVRVYNLPAVVPPTTWG